jgi:hypothetical protein
MNARRKVNARVIRRDGGEVGAPTPAEFAVANHPPVEDGAPDIMVPQIRESERSGLKKIETAKGSQR